MKAEQYEYIGDLSQLFRVETCRLEGGKKDGVRATFVTNETGLSYTVAADRCMDIPYLSYKGVNISYVNPCGIVGPQYYDRTGTNWLKSFTGGLVATCGLDNVGNPCTEGEELGLHGRIGNTPAEEYSVQMKKEGQDNLVQISGVMRQSFIFGDKLRLHRNITSYQEKTILEIEDEITNTGFEEQEYMQLYHCNIGYPFLSPACELFIPSLSVKGANPYSQENIDKWDKIEEPSKVGEMCFWHQLKDQDGTYCVGMFNHEKKIGFSLRFENHDLNRFLQWRYLNKGEYVIGLEPATNYAGGKIEEKTRDVIKKIPPQASVKHKLVFTFVDSVEELKESMRI